MPLLGDRGLRALDGDGRARLPRRLRARPRPSPTWSRARSPIGSGASRSWSRAGSSACPVPFLLIAAPDWAWVVVANILLGVNQGLTWSTTVLMKIDLVGPRETRARARAQRGGRLPRRRRDGLPDRRDRASRRVCARRRSSSASRSSGLGLGASVLFVRETRGHVLAESADASRHPRPRPTGSDSPGAARSPTARCRPPRRRASSTT